MQKKVSNLAVVSNHTFEATKAINLHNYDISSALQTTLEFDELISIFSHKIQQLIPHSGYVYSNKAFEIEHSKGIVTRNSCTYTLMAEKQSLGVFKLMRRNKFDDNELKLLETLLCCLIYPLKNATLFHNALKMAHTDPLTHTRNRAAFDDMVKREIKLAKRHSSHLSVIFLDIDHFKSINDNYGHDCGDQALKCVANCINKTIRDSDIAFRYGGEEFVILMSDTDLQGAALLSERIRVAIENLTLAYGMEVLKMTASLGVTSLLGNDDLDSFVKRADTAMYQAKQSGRNRVIIN